MGLERFTFLFLVLTLSLGMVSCSKDDSDPRKGKTSAVFNPDKEYGTVTDIDGNEYRTITIGTQTWMAENLRVTHYRNGDPIPNVKDNKTWSKQTAGAYCSYGNTSDVDSVATYGYLYNWFACVDKRELCPDGWHVPSDEEWTTLITYLDNGDNAFDPNGTGDNGVVGGRIKEAESTHWGISNRSDNSSGLTALPGGLRQGYSGLFCYSGWRGFFWSSTSYADKISAFHRSLSSMYISVVRQALPYEDGMSVRCVKD